MSKKNIIKLLQVLFIVIVFITLVAFTNEDTGVYYFKTSYDNNMKNSYIIETFDELELIISDHEILNKFDDEYFHEKQLVLLVIPMESSDITINVKNYNIEESIINIELQKHYPQYADTMMIDYNILIEVDKVELEEVVFNIESY